MLQNTLLLWSFLLALLDTVSLVCELAFASHLYPVRKKIDSKFLDKSKLIIFDEVFFKNLMPTC